jgi:AcrR family transcriptional regulator
VSTNFVTVSPQVSLATKVRILESAETLFMEHGFEATSLRLITNAAGVNLAAVNYHFGSKEELFQSVLTRRLDPMNQARVALLDGYERDGPSPLACERILAALFIPALELARDPARGGSNFLRLLGRAYADPAPFIRQFLSQQYAPMIARFKDAFARALPHLPRKELSWRLHFIMGALSYTLAGTDALKIIAELNPVETDNDEILLRRLAPFLLAGLNAPLPELSEVSREFDNALAGTI